MQSADRVDEILNFRSRNSRDQTRSIWSLQSRLDGNDLSLSVARVVLNGAALALLWAILFRVWMRMISDKPEFSITGTLILLGAAVFVGGCAGLAYALRRRGAAKRMWIPRLISILSFAALGFGPGLIVVPTILFATLALTRKTWVGWLRVLCALVALLGIGMITKIMLSFWPPLASAIFMLLYLAFLYPPIIAMRMGLEASQLRSGSE